MKPNNQHCNIAPQGRVRNYLLIEFNLKLISIRKLLRTSNRMIES